MTLAMRKRSLGPGGWLCVFGGELLIIGIVGFAVYGFGHAVWVFLRAVGLVR